MNEFFNQIIESIFIGNIDVFISMLTFILSFEQYLILNINQNLCDF